MVYVLTVHWKSDRWIEIQTRYLKRYLAAPFSLWCCFTGIPSRALQAFDRRYETTVKEHADKLNFLARKVLEAGASDSDILVFLDGDAFPIRPLAPRLAELLSEFPLVAILRSEEGDPQPHPSFCATRVGFWRSIQGDWGKGFYWKLAGGGRRTDVGARLLENLQDRGIEWGKLLRTRDYGSHGLYFATYGNLIYHHGAAFREPFSTYDMLHNRWARFLFKVTPEKQWPRVERMLVPIKKTIERNAQESEAIYRRIVAEPDLFAKGSALDVGT